MENHDYVPRVILGRFKRHDLRSNVSSAKITGALVSGAMFLAQMPLFEMLQEAKQSQSNEYYISY